MSVLLTARLTRRIVALTLSLLVSPLASAHLLKVFVYADGDRLQGSSYFAGGAAAKGASIRILTADGDEIAKLKTDALGEFSFPISAAEDYRVIADSGDGHRAEWSVRADELLPSNPTQSETAATASQLQPSLDSHAELALLMERSVARAVAKQIGPLRQQLQRNADKARLADIIGGIGFIFGLAGMLLWWRSRR